MLQRLMSKRTNKTSLAEIDTTYKNNCVALNFDPAIQNEEWIEFCLKIQPEDEIWEYNDMHFLSGTAGYLLVRQGVPVEHYVERMS